MSADRSQSAAARSLRVTPSASGHRPLLTESSRGCSQHSWLRLSASRAHVLQISSRCAAARAIAPAAPTCHSWTATTAPVGSPSPAGLQITITVLPSSRDLACTGFRAPKQEQLLLSVAAAVQQTCHRQPSLHCCALAAKKFFPCPHQRCRAQRVPRNCAEYNNVLQGLFFELHFVFQKLHLRSASLVAGPGPPTAAPAARMPLVLRRQASRRKAPRSTSPVGCQTDPGRKTAGFRVYISGRTAHGSTAVIWATNLGRAAVQLWKQSRGVACMCVCNKCTVLQVETAAGAERHYECIRN